MNAQSLLMSAAYYMEDVSDPVSTLLWIGLAILVALILVVVFLRFVPLGLWITSLAAGVHVSISSLVGMRLRRIQPKRLVEAEAEVPKARAAALREGKLGVMDYYQMKNVEADTNMRDSIAKVSAPPVNSEGKK